MPRIHLSVLIAIHVAASPLLLAGSADAVPLFGRWEHAFAAGREISSTRDVALTVRFTGPRGENRVVDGFWDGGKGFKVRFMPTALGVWKFAARSDPRISGLDGVSGSFRCQRDESKSRFLKHGPIRVSRNGRFFEHADGTPFFWLADTAWNGALKSGAEDWGRYLDDRADKKLTGIQFVTTQWRTAYTDRDGRVAYRGLDRIEIDPRFYQRLDARVDAVNNKGLLAIPVVLWTLGDRSIG